MNKMLLFRDFALLDIMLSSKVSRIRLFARFVKGKFASLTPARAAFDLVSSRLYTRNKKKVSWTPQSCKKSRRKTGSDERSERRRKGSVEWGIDNQPVDKRLGYQQQVLSNADTRTCSRSLSLSISISLSFLSIHALAVLPIDTRYCVGRASVDKLCLLSLPFPFLVGNTHK